MANSNTTGPQDPRVSDDALWKTSVILCAISLGILAILIILTFIPIFRKSSGRGRYVFYQGGDTMQMCFFYVTTFAYFLLFVLTFDRTMLKMSESTCAKTAVGLHFLVLSIALIATASGLNFMRSYVVILQSGGTLRPMKHSGWAAPLVSWIISAIVAGVCYAEIEDYYERHDDFCWLKPKLTLYAVICVVTALAFFVVLNLLIFTVVWFSFNRKMRALEDHSEGMAKEWMQYASFVLRCLVVIYFDIIWIMSYVAGQTTKRNNYHIAFAALNGLFAVWLLLLFIIQQYLTNRSIARNTYQVNPATLLDSYD